MPELENKLAAPEGCAPLTCSALRDALMLVKCSPRKSEDAQVWWDAASTMIKHCRGLEDVTEAAARILEERIEDMERSAEMNAAIWEQSRERTRNITRKCCDAMGVLRRGGEDQAMLAELREILLPNATALAPADEKTQPKKSDV